jgi:signal transduction histidine kinase
MLLFRIFTSETSAQRTENIFIFTVSLFVGYLIIWTGIRQVRNREKGEQLTRHLAGANARLRELDKQKTEFLSIASHQLRSPIAAIKGYSSLLKEGSYGPVPQKLEKPLSRVLESGKRVAIMVDDFLNVTRMEQGRMKYAHEAADILSIVSAAIEDLRVMSESKKLALTLDVSCTQPVYIMGDEAKLKQAFSNLIENAIKFTREGWVHVAVREVPSNNAVLIKVSDSGIGVPREEREMLFRKFSRASNADEVSVYGTGLGLYIAREIVRAHNGWIHLSSSEVERGSTFSVELPITKTSSNKVTRHAVKRTLSSCPATE